jgi:hypothetical protein
LLLLLGLLGLLLLLSLLLGLGLGLRLLLLLLLPRILPWCRLCPRLSLRLRRGCWCGQLLPWARTGLWLLLLLLLWRAVAPGRCGAVLAREFVRRCWWGRLVVWVLLLVVVLVLLLFWLLLLSRSCGLRLGLVPVGCRVGDLALALPVLGFCHGGDRTCAHLGRPGSELSRVALRGGGGPEVWCVPWLHGPVVRLRNGRGTSLGVWHGARAMGARLPGRVPDIVSMRRRQQIGFRRLLRWSRHL